MDGYAEGVQVSMGAEQLRLLAVYQSPRNPIGRQLMREPSTGMSCLSSGLHASLCIMHWRPGK